MAFHWRANDGPTLNAGFAGLHLTIINCIKFFCGLWLWSYSLTIFVIFQGIRTMLLRNLWFLWFSREKSGHPVPCPHPPLDPPMHMLPCTLGWIPALWCSYLPVPTIWEHSYSTLHIRACTMLYCTLGWIPGPWCTYLPVPTIWEHSYSTLHIHVCTYYLVPQAGSQLHDTLTCQCQRSGNTVIIHDICSSISLASFRRRDGTATLYLRLDPSSMMHLPASANDLGTQL